MGNSTKNLLTDELKKQFAGILLLDRMNTDEMSIHFSLMDRDDQLLEPYLKEMEKKGIIEVGEDDIYCVSSKGEEAYQKVLQQQESYVTHFDIFSHVDLEAGVFADKDRDLLEDERWSDLRVAVAKFKGIDPYRIVFLAMLSDEVFFENPDWKFDLAMGNLFEEMESIVEEQITIEELAYSDGDEFISGEDVIRDIIEQGDEINRENQEKETYDSQSPESEDVIITTYYEPYW